MMKSFMNKVQEGVSDWAKTVITTGGEISLKKSFAKIWIPCFNKTTGECSWLKKRKLPRAVLKAPQRDGSVEVIEIKETDSAPKFLGLELAFDNGWDKIQLARIRKMGTEWTDKIRKAAYMSVNNNWESSSVQLKPKLEYGIVVVCAPPAKLEETSTTIHYHALSPLGINQNINKKVRLLHRMYQGAKMLDLNHSCCSANSDTSLKKMLNVALDTFIVDTGLNEEVFNMDLRQ